MTEKHNHYFHYCPYDKIDIYRLIDVLKITHPCAQHIFKKSAVAGNRGHKDLRRDIEDMRDTAIRWLEMMDEDASFAAKPFVGIEKDD